MSDDTIYPSLHAAATAVYARHNTICLEAADELEAIINGNDQLRADAVRKAASALLVDAMRSHRHNCVVNPETLTPDNLPEVPKKESKRRYTVEQQERATNFLRGLLGFDLKNGTPLGNANRQMLIENVDYYQGIADEQGHKAAWLRRIADKLPEGKLVKEHFTEKELEELRRNTGPGGSKKRPA